MYYDKSSSNISYNQEKVIKNKYIKLFQWQCIWQNIGWLQKFVPDLKIKYKPLHRKEFY